MSKQNVYEKNPDSTDSNELYCGMPRDIADQAYSIRGTVIANLRDGRTIRWRDRFDKPETTPVD